MVLCNTLALDHLQGFNVVAELLTSGIFTKHTSMLQKKADYMIFLFLKESSGVILYYLNDKYD